MTETKKPSINLTIYLLKSEITSSNAILTTPNKDISQFHIAQSRKVIGELYVQAANPKPPRWARYFREYINVRELGKVSSASAVLLVRSDDRHFAITFGLGRYLLVPESWEERFGLIVALNCLGEKNVRGIDRRTFDAISRHSREQASRETSARDFGLDIERDLLRAVTGTPMDTTYGNKMYGMDALNVSINAEIGDINQILSRYYKKYLDRTYKKNFPWVDQISEVKNTEARERLDNLLIARIKSKQHDRIWMAVPEVVPWERVKEFRYAFGTRSPGYLDIHLDDFLESLEDPDSVDREKLSRRHVHCLDHEGLPIDKWPAYKCLYAEIDDGEDSYLLSGGKWYKVTPNFVADVNEAFKRIPTFAKTLPEYNDPSETAYNERVAASDPSRIALMDRKIILHGGGYSQIEFCDLYTNEREIIHIKRYGGSSVLSHLFAQGLSSGELFQIDSQFRGKVNERLPERFKIKEISKRPESGEYRVVFGIISDTPGELILPFFSRLNLKHAVTRLEGYGYRVAKVGISINEALSKLRKF